MIDLGSVYQVAVDVRDADGTLTDPVSATLTITLPDGTTVTPAVPLPSSTPGELRVDYVTSQAGRHTWRLVTTSPTTAYTEVFDVAPSAPISIVSLARAKKQLNIDSSDTTDDEELRGFITGASLAVERHLGQIVARRSFSERCTVDAYGQILLSHVPVLSLTAVASADGATTWTVGDLHADADSGIVHAATGPALTGDVDVTHQAGMRVVPEDYQLATLIIIQHLWETQRGAIGVLLGGEGEAWQPGRGYAIPRRALELLDSPLPGIA
ncbi:hypothetical protein [Streptomyces sp. G1]|uniref:hypothetical protein n=1 Tax=Streptomyces sp. G1 TaxID=361572 RepID=UPI0020309C07|nr:hypothetical protein [Streptomyces sp. G1]MCM1972326.1 hypothetical protein [Streptomyces sp. G1]